MIHPTPKIFLGYPPMVEMTQALYHWKKLKLLPLHEDCPCVRHTAASLLQAALHLLLCPTQPHGSSPCWMSCQGQAPPSRSIARPPSLSHCFCSPNPPEHSNTHTHTHTLSLSLRVYACVFLSSKSFRASLTSLI